MERDGAKVTLMWGMAVWATLAEEVVNYDTTPSSYILKIRNGGTSLTHYMEDWEEQTESSHPLWEVVSGATLWALWKARNTAMFEAAKKTPQ